MVSAKLTECLVSGSPDTTATSAKVADFSGNQRETEEKDQTCGLFSEVLREQGAWYGSTQLAPLKSLLMFSLAVSGQSDV